jgi:hypothetical protein
MYHPHDRGGDDRLPPQVDAPAEDAWSDITIEPCVHAFILHQRFVPRSISITVW